MDAEITAVLMAVAIAATAFFLHGWWTSSQAWTRATAVERANLAIESARADEERLSILQKLQALVARSGWSGTLRPVVIGATFIYAAVTLAFGLFDFPDIVAVVAGLPAAFGVATLIAYRYRARQQSLFQRQLGQALQLLAAQIESGNGVQRSMEQIVGSLENPLGGEMARALSSTLAANDLVAVLSTIRDRYPSRAFDLFIAALEVDRYQGGALVPALRQASAILEQQFELIEEATAEISQAKAEFWAIVGIIGTIAVSILGSADSSAMAAYLSPVGMAVIGGATINFAIGIWRSLKMFAAVRRGTT